ncbi:MAG: GTPase HflX, partial [Alphaproteobacteria bacterium]
MGRDARANGAAVGGARAAVLHPYDKRPAHGAKPGRAPAAALAEAVGLEAAIDLDVVLQRLVPMTRVRPSTYLGEGTLAALVAAVAEAGIAVVIVDTALAAVQQRNLERALNAKVIDRTGLILEIFGARARTREGVLQVELAHLSYQQSRLVRSWTHLERQRGGFGFLGGPGESQIETDRRLLRDRIAHLRRDLDQVRRTRALHRRRRAQAPYPVVALVGYTNAGKSTLFNRATAAAVAAKDMLFSTLDTTIRQLPLKSGQTVLLSDTVGF